MQGRINEWIKSGLTWDVDLKSETRAAPGHRAPRDRGDRSEHDGQGGRRGISAAGELPGSDPAAPARTILQEVRAEIAKRGAINCGL